VATPDASPPDGTTAVLVAWVTLSCGKITTKELLLQVNLK
jgi:hypothetical protein